jgi:hypothetical protein
MFSPHFLFSPVPLLLSSPLPLPLPLSQSLPISPSNLIYPSPHILSYPPLPLFSPTHSYPQSGSVAAMDFDKDSCELRTIFCGAPLYFVVADLKVTVPPLHSTPHTYDVITPLTCIALCRNDM